MKTRRAEKSLKACYSFRGHDFFEPGMGDRKRRDAKRITRRARRRLDRAIVRADGG